jgi:Dolichyl-phosphate-mannose-protein mannosyltransferase
LFKLHLKNIEARNRWKVILPAVLLCIGLSSLAVLPFFVIGEDPAVGCCGGEMPVTHDGAMHYNQMRSFRDGLAAGRIFPRWESETHYGHGAPTTSFYPPGVYYLTSSFYLLLGDWRRVLILLHLVMMIASGAAIYWYARQTMSRGASLMAMAVYIIAPYHLLNQYQRGAIAEQMSFVWMPLILLFADRLRRDERSLPDFAILAILFAAFLYSHPPTAYQFVLVFGTCFSIWAVKQGNWRGLGLIALSLIVGSLVAAAYFYPAIVEQPLIYAEDVERTWPYHSSYVFDYAQKIYDRGTDQFFVRIDRIWVFSAVAVVLTGLVLLIVGNHLKSTDLKSIDLRSSMFLWIGAGVLAVFLMTRYSYPLSRLIPKIEIGVFSWRMLSLASLAVALLAGLCWQAAIDQIGKRRLPSLILCAASSWLFLAAAIAVSAWYVVMPMYRVEAFKPIPGHYNYATLPRGVPRDVPKMEPAQLASGAGSVKVELWQPELRRVRVETDRADRLQFRTSNYPGWTALVDGKVTEIKTGDAGMIVIDLPAGEHSITLDYRLTTIRRVSVWITLISSLLLFSLVVIAKWKSRARTEMK